MGAVGAVGEEACLEPAPAVVLNRIGDLPARMAGYERLVGPLGPLGTLEGIAPSLARLVSATSGLRPDVQVLLHDGYLGLRRDHPGQAVTPPRKGNKISPPEVLQARLRARHRHSSKRITVEHALADHKR